METPVVRERDWIAGLLWTIIQPAATTVLTMAVFVDRALLCRSGRDYGPAHPGV